MALQRLQEKSGSGVVTIPKSELRADDILDNGAIPKEQCISIDKLGRRTFLIRFPEGGGDLPDLAECEHIRRIAAEMALSKDPSRLGQPAD